MKPFTEGQVSAIICAALLFGAACGLWLGAEYGRSQVLKPLPVKVQQHCVECHARRLP